MAGVPYRGKREATNVTYPVSSILTIPTTTKKERDMPKLTNIFCMFCNRLEPMPHKCHKLHPCFPKFK